MERHNRKIKITLILFLSIFSLLVNTAAFYILTDYNTRHYTALSRSHMEQQYQNYQQKLAVLGEQIRLFGDNPQFTNAIERHDWTAVNEKISDFIRSSGNIVSLRIYCIEDGVLKRARGDSNVRYAELEPERIAEMWNETKQKGDSALWFLREGTARSSECLSYLMPVSDEGKQIAYLTADLDVSSFMQDSIKEENVISWQETVAIVSPDRAWFGIGRRSEELQPFLEAENTEFDILAGRTISIRELPQSRDRLIQVIHLQMDKLLWQVGGMVAVLFLISILLIFLGVRFVSDSIMVPLNKLKHRMHSGLEGR